MGISSLISTLGRTVFDREFPSLEAGKGREAGWSGVETRLVPRPKHQTNHDHSVCHEILIDFPRVRLARQGSTFHAPWVPLALIVVSSWNA